MSTFKHPVHLPEPSFTELYRGFVEFDSDIEHTEIGPGCRRAFKVVSGSVTGKVNADIVPVVSTLWKSVDASGALCFESKFVAKPGKLTTISCDVYGSNKDMFYILYDTGWPKYTWLAHTITFIKVDSVEGNRVSFTCLQVD